MTKNPWRTLRSRIVYENPWIRVREDDVIRPDGNPGIYGVVETRIATGVVALTPDENVILVGQYRYPLQQYSWEIVEGGSDGDESPLEAVKRELREEAGFVARRWEQLGSQVHLSNCLSSEVAYLYLAEDLEEVGANPDGTEELAVKTVSLDEAVAMVRRGEITDAMSVIALERAAFFVKVRKSVR